jgi:hypothetical protein
MTHDEIRVLIIQSLAEKKQQDPAELMAELAAAGSEYPYDSIWLVKAGARAARVMGLKLKGGGGSAQAFKSVEALARHLHDLDRHGSAA